jgi:hypothetical protein
VHSARPTRKDFAKPGTTTRKPRATLSPAIIAEEETATGVSAIARANAGQRIGARRSEIAASTSRENPAGIDLKFVSPTIAISRIRIAIELESETSIALCAHEAMSSAPIAPVRHDAPAGRNATHNPPSVSANKPSETPSSALHNNISPRKITNTTAPRTGSARTSARSFDCASAVAASIGSTFRSAESMSQHD